MGDTARGRAVVQNPPTHPPPANTFQGMVGASTPLLPAKIFSNPAEKAEIYWNPLAPKFYEHLVYGAGKPRCVVPLGAFASACKQDETFANELRQQYTDMARNSTTDGLTNLAFFLLIIDNDLENGGDILKDAAKRHPTAFNLCQYARFAYNCKKEYTAAWQLFEKALVADPTHVDTIGYYAGFVASVQRDYDHAERLFLRCLELAPEHPNHLGGYARFLATVRGRHEDAETYFERSIAADPCNVVNLNNYAAFLAEIRKDYVTAEEFFRKAVDMDPSCGFAVRNLLNFLVLMRGDEAAAKELWQRGGEEALRLSLDETYHPDEICPAVRQDMAAEAKFMQQGRDLLNEKLKLSAVSNEDEMCVSCGQGNAAFVISRQCGSSQCRSSQCSKAEATQCEGPECSCIGVRWCASCVLQHYWHDSKGCLKSFSRCPTCRAEFCLDDIQLAEACVDTCSSVDEEVSDTDSSASGATTDSSMDMDY